MDNWNKIKKSSTFVSVLRFVIFGGIFYYIISKVNMGLFIKNLNNINYLFIILAILISILVIYLNSLRLSYILKNSKNNIKRTRLFLTIYFSQFVDNFFFGFIGGDVYKLTNIKGNKKTILKSIMQDRLTGLFVLFITAIPGVVWYSMTRFYLPFELSSQIITITTFLIALITIPIIYFFKKKCTNRAVLSGKIFIKDTLQLFKDFKLMILALSIQVAMIFNLYLIFLALGWEVSVISSLLYLPLISLIIILPISIKGYGIRELLLIHFFSISFDQVLVFTLLNTTITILHTSLGAFIHFIYESKLSNSKN